MGVYIKGLEMPGNCRACHLATRFFDGEDVCAMLGTYVHDRDREEDCPLVPVPPHGRLIDADALEEILLKVIDINASIEQRNEATEQERRCLWWFEQQIGIAPTIIPAEEGE